MPADVYLPLSHWPERELKAVEIEPDCPACDGTGWVPEEFTSAAGERFTEHLQCRACGGAGVQKGAKAP